MPKIRNRSTRRLEVAGRSFRVGEVVEVGENEAAYLLTNPNFELMKPKPPKQTEGADGAGKKD